jgi:hypothetical protein
MRTAQPAERNRSPVVVRLAVDGRTQERVFQPKGFKSDGASVGEMRVRLTPGVHEVAVSVATRREASAPRQTWRAQVRAVPGRLTVLTLEAGGSFQWEP